jgi:hypothetical protein
MKDEKIIEMAKQTIYNDDLSDRQGVLAFARLVSARQREIDAEICLRWVSNPMWETAGIKNAEAIRSQT